MFIRRLLPLLIRYLSSLFKVEIKATKCPPLVTTGNNKIDQLFYKHLCNLQVFIRKHGHCNVVAKEDEKLYNFCDNVNKGKVGNFTREKYDALSSIGFKFQKSSPYYADDREMAGEGIVQIDDEDEGPSAQDGQNASCSMDKKVDLSEQGGRKNGFTAQTKRGSIASTYLFQRDSAQDKSRVHTNSTKSLGQCKPPFVTTGNRKKDKQNDQQFYEHLCNLQDFIVRHGHCKVPRKIDKRLSNFCYYINHHKSLTKERIGALKSIGFKFAATSPYACHNIPVAPGILDRISTKTRKSKRELKKTQFLIKSEIYEVAKGPPPRIKNDIRKNANQKSIECSNGNDVVAKKQNAQREINLDQIGSQEEAGSRCSSRVERNAVNDEFGDVHRISVSGPPTTSTIRKPPFVTTGNRKKDKQNDQQFYEHLCNLQDFIVRHGHCKVPRKIDKRLSNFCYYINHHKSLTKERIGALKSIGFKFAATSPYAYHNRRNGEDDSSAL